jgi:hypothetical protein
MFRPDHWRYNPKKGNSNEKGRNSKSSGCSVIVSAGVPLTNLEGVGGVAFNPLAYPANPGTSWGDPNSTTGKIFGKPQIGAWYVNLGQSHIDWTSLGFAETFFGRLEVSYGHEVVSLNGYGNIKKENVGAKYLLVKENSWDQPWLPAISAGVVAKHTTNNPYEHAEGINSGGYDIYAVATKLITQTPIPVLLSGGVVSTDSQTTGVLGYNDDRDLTGFGNVDLVLTKEVAVGVEYKQGAEYNNTAGTAADWKDANYWDLHTAWFINPNTTLVVAYVNAGDEKSTTKHGLGEGLVLSLQYAF